MALTEIRAATAVDVLLTGQVTGKMTTLTAASATGLPSPTAGQFARAVLYDANEEAAGGPWEVIYITARASAVLTVERGMEATKAQHFAYGVCRLRLQPTDTADAIVSIGAETIGLAEIKHEVKDYLLGAEVVGLAEIKHEAKDRLPALPASPADNAKVLTASAGAMVWAAAPGSGSLLKASVALTDAQIKALPTTPVEIIGAPAPDSIIVPLHAVIQIDAVMGGYTNVDVACLGGILHTAGAWPPTWAFTPLDEALSEVTDFLNSGDVDTSAGVILQGANSDATPYAWEWLAGQALEFRFDNKLAGDFTGGHASNAGVVTVYYYVLDTGLVAS